MVQGRYTNNESCRPWFLVGFFGIDGARYFDGVVPDLYAHCKRLNESAKAMMISPTMSAKKMVENNLGWARFLINFRLHKPMYWAIDGDESAIVPQSELTGLLFVWKVRWQKKFGVTLTTTRV